VTSYGGLRGYGGDTGGGFGPPPPGGGMPYRQVESTGRDESVPARLRPRRRSSVAVWRRAGAIIVDLLLMGIPVAAVWWTAASVLWPSSCEQVQGFEGENVLLDCNPAVLVLCWVLVIATIVAVAWRVTLRAWRSGRPTFGGRRFGVSVIDSVTGDAPSTGRCVVRLLVRTLISPILGIGFLWMIWDRDDRTLHDLAARTAVESPG
jgi:uncharacterized RDD family membrane protein YckC